MSSLDGVNALGLSKEKRERRQYERVQMSAFVISSNKSLGESLSFILLIQNCKRLQKQKTLGAHHNFSLVKKASHTSILHWLLVLAESCQQRRMVDRKCLFLE